MEQRNDRPYRPMTKVQICTPVNITMPAPQSRKRTKNIFTAEFELNKRRIAKGNKFIQVLKNVKNSQFIVKGPVTKAKSYLLPPASLQESKKISNEEEFLDYVNGLFGINSTSYLYFHK